MRRRERAYHGGHKVILQLLCQNAHGGYHVVHDAARSSVLRQCALSTLRRTFGFGLPMYARYWTIPRAVPAKRLRKCVAWPHDSAGRTGKTHSASLEEHEAMQISVERPPRPLLSRSRPMRAIAHISCRQAWRRFRNGHAWQRCEERTESCMRLR